MRFRVEALILAAALAAVPGGGAAAQSAPTAGASARRAAPGLAYADAARLYGAAFVEARRRADYLAGRLVDAGISLAQDEAREAVAVAFPELLRYASLRDRLETAALEALYVRNGAGDFSIGPLQMKPSFAERLEEWAARLPRAAAILSVPAPPDAEAGRRARIGRIKSMVGQAPYLAAFYLVAAARFPELAGLAARDRVAFLAAAYNAGFHKERERIEAAMALAIFPPPPGWPDPLSYVELSVGYFESRNP